MTNFTKIILALTVVLAFQSCSKDDDKSTSPSPTTITVDPSNTEEDLPIPIEKINTGVAIEGATKLNGLPPAPNSNLDFNVANTDLVAVQTGFNVKINSTADVAGAYILFGDKSGNKASSYFNVPVTSFTNSGGGFKIGKKSSKPTASSQQKTNVEGEYEINVNLIDFPAGQFCGELCIYDSQSNVSQIVSFCVEVEAWGGSSSFVGEWSIPSYIDDYQSTIYCNSNQQTFQAPWEKDVVSSGSVKFNADGTYTVTESGTSKELDYEASAQSCTPIYINSSWSYTETGKWAYNEEQKSLIIITFSSTDTYDGQTYTETYPNGDLAYDSTNSNSSVQIIGNKLIVTETYVEGGQTYTETFELTRI